MPSQYWRKKTVLYLHAPVPAHTLLSAYAHDDTWFHICFADEVDSPASLAGSLPSAGNDEEYWARCGVGEPTVFKTPVPASGGWAKVTTNTCLIPKTQHSVRMVGFWAHMPGPRSQGQEESCSDRGSL